MAETIYTIPITEAFGRGDGCPFCALRRDLEAEVAAYITGPAMMEPDVRRETNRLGFCRVHYDTLLRGKNRLALALILESHLGETAETLTAPTGRRSRFGGGRPEAPGPVAERADSCYICTRLETLEGRVTANAVHMWRTDEAFRARFAGRTDYCLPHGAALLTAAERDLGGSQYQAFHRELTACLSRRIAELLPLVRGFARSFDYRNAGVDLTEEEKQAVELAAAFLSGDGGG